MQEMPNNLQVCGSSKRLPGKLGDYLSNPESRERTLGGFPAFGSRVKSQSRKHEREKTRKRDRWDTNSRSFRAEFWPPRSTSTRRSVQAFWNRSIKRRWKSR